jgi:hypothetical protein
MSSNHPQQYIVEQDTRHQESVATRYLVEDPLCRERLLGHLGITDFCWVLLELRLEKILPGKAGEIDILAGPLTWRDPQTFALTVKEESVKLPPKCESPALAWRIAAFNIAASGGITWPPALDYFVGVEVKRAYRDTRGHLRSTKGGSGQLRTTRKELNRDLHDLCLDRVALVDIIAHFPATGTGSDPWLAAAAVASDSLRSMESILLGRLNKGSSPIKELHPVGHFAWSIGSVEGGDETIRGAVMLDLLREAKANPWRYRRDRVLEERLLQLLSNVPSPSTWPFILKDCRSCDQIHLADGPCRMAQNRGLR